MILLNSNKEFPRFIGDLQIEYPDYKLGDALPKGWYQVIETPAPDVEEGFVALWDSFEEKENKYYLTWKISEVQNYDAPSTLDNLDY